MCMKKCWLAGLMTNQYKKLPVTMKMGMQFSVMPWTWNWTNTVIPFYWSQSHHSMLSSLFLILLVGVVAGQFYQSLRVAVAGQCHCQPLLLLVTIRYCRSLSPVASCSCRWSLSLEVPDAEGLPITRSFSTVSVNWYQVTSDNYQW